MVYTTFFVPVTRLFNAVQARAMVVSVWRVLSSIRSIAFRIILSFQLDTWLFLPERLSQHTRKGRFCTGLLQPKLRSGCDLIAQPRYRDGMRPNAPDQS